MSTLGSEQVPAVDLTDYCANDVVDRLFDKSPEANAYMELAVPGGDTMKLLCVKCGHCVMRGMEFEAPLDPNACITA